MFRLTASLEAWLHKFHSDVIVVIGFDHSEWFTDEMKRDYLKWCTTDEGKQYLVGGALYHAPR